VDTLGLRRVRPAYEGVSELYAEVHAAVDIGAVKALQAEHQLPKLQAERPHLDAELVAARQAVTAYRQSYRDAELPANLAARWDKAVDAVVGNESAQAAAESWAGMPKRKRKPTAREREVVAALERALQQARAYGQREGRAEYARASGWLVAALRPPGTGSALARARNDVRHPEHMASQWVNLPDGGRGQIFTGR